MACGIGNDTDDDSSSVTAVATTTQLADFARNVGGERIRVEQLLDANVDPHDYEPSPSDAESLAEADIIFRAGFDLDEWLDELIENAGGDASVVDTSENVETGPLPETEHEDEEENGEEVDDGDAHGHDEVDPHIWLDPSKVLVIVDNIVEGLSEVDPDGAEVYATNAAQYKSEVMEMDSEVAEIFSACEPSELKLVTNHDSLNYLAERYGLTVVGAVIPTLETTAEPSAEDLAELIELIEQENVQAIFSESSLNTELEEQVAAESGATVVADLYTDSLGPEDSEAATYIEMMTHNAETIVEGLECA
jgi:ABC-type Zn uptake system ZnuABC Zn-binding protein ZnuA